MGTSVMLNMSPDQAHLLSHFLELVHIKHKGEIIVKS